MRRIHLELDSSEFDVPAPALVMARLVPTGFAHLPNGVLLGRLSLFPLVMARLVRATCPNAGYDTGGPDKPGHDVVEPVFRKSFRTGVTAVGLVRANHSSMCRDRWPGRAGP